MPDREGRLLYDKLRVTHPHPDGAGRSRDHEQGLAKGRTGGSRKLKRQDLLSPETGNVRVKIDLVGGDAASGRIQVSNLDGNRAPAGRDAFRSDCGGCGRDHPRRQGRMAAALEALLEAVIRKLEAAPEGLMPVSLVTFPEILNSPNTGLA